MSHCPYIEIKKIKIRPDDINPRTIDEKGMRDLCKSIKKNPDFFEARPILYNKSMFVFAGHQRYRASVSLGLKKVPAVLLSVTPAREKKLMLLDNVNNGKFDFDMLSTHFEIGELREVGFSDELINTAFDLVPEKKKESKGGGGPFTKVCPKCGHEWED